MKYRKEIWWTTYDGWFTSCFSSESSVAVPFKYNHRVYFRKHIKWNTGVNSIIFNKQCFDNAWHYKVNTEVKATGVDNEEVNIE